MKPDRGAFTIFVDQLDSGKRLDVLVASRCGGFPARIWPT